ncbi:MAG: hypothetical protein V7765_19600 [Oleispira sp.]
MMKHILAVAITSVLVACGGGNSGSSSSENDGAAQAPVLNFKASMISYAAIKNGENGSWTKLEIKDQKITPADSTGKISIVNVCGNNEVYVDHWVVDEPRNYDYSWCGLENQPYVDIEISSAGFEIYDAAISGLIGRETDVNKIRVSASELSEHTVWAYGKQTSTDKIFFLRKDNVQLTDEQVLSLDFSEAVEVEVAGAQVANDFEYDLDLLVGSSVGTTLSLTSDLQNLNQYLNITSPHVKDGELFSNTWGFGDDSQLKVISESIMTSASDLSTVNSTNLKATDIVAAQDKKSFSYPVIDSGISDVTFDYVEVYFAGHAAEYTVDLEFLNGRTVELLDFSMLPEYSGPNMSESFTTVDSLHEFHSSTNYPAAGSKQLLLGFSL